jgi:hypothetical protein
MARPKMIGPVVASKEFSVSPGFVAAGTTLDIPVTVKGLRKGHPVKVWAPDLEGNLSLSNEHCSDKDTLIFRLLNPTASGITPASQTMYVVQF